MYEIEIDVYVLNELEEEYDEVPLMIQFLFDKNGYEIKEYVLFGNELSLVDLNELKKDNKYLDKKIANAIDHFITNYEEEDSWIVL